MKLTSSVVTRSLVLAAALAALLLTPATGIQAAPAANQITVHDQNLDTGIVVVDSVTAARGSWVVIYKDADFTVDNLVGYAPVHEGLNLGVKVVVSLPKIDHAPMLWAVLQSDKGTPGVFEWGLKNRAYNDDPLAENARVVMTQFKTTAPAPLPVFLTMSSGGAPLETLPANQITIHNQDVRSGVILVDDITTTEPGWVVFYKNPNLTPGEIVGYAPVYPGINTNVKAAIDTTKLGQATEIWAQLHTDEGRRGVFEWGRQVEPLADWPMVRDRSYARASFSTTAAPVPTTTVNLKAAQIAIHDQTLDTGIITVDSVTTPRNGWIVVYKDPGFTSGQFVGYAPVYQGMNQGVKVTVDTAKVGEQPTLWLVLHVDGGLQNVFEWGYNGRPFSDPPMFRQGQYVSAAFNTTAQQLNQK